MARRTRRPEADSRLRLVPLRERCPGCGGPFWVAYHGTRTVARLDGLVRLTLVVRRCGDAACPLFRKPYRPEGEGALALPEGEFGLDVIALVGALRYDEHRSVPEIHRDLVGRGLGISERTVTNLVARYEELVA